MKPVCVITGGGSGMGRATAKLVCEAGYHVILVGRTAAKLESAVAELTEAGHEAQALACDRSDRSSLYRAGIPSFHKVVDYLVFSNGIIS